MNFSFSSVNSYTNCPRCFWLTYLCEPKLERDENAFAQWGSFMHEMYERFYGGELDFFDVCSVYEDEYDKRVPLRFPYNKFVNLTEKYRQSGLDALERFEELSPNIEVVGIECKILTKVNGVPFVGYADLILRNKETKEIYIVDHKSKAKFKSKAEQKEYARQLYLYSLYVKEKYGVYPTKLIFNMFRVGDTVEIDFNEDDLQEAIDWFSDTVASIYLDSEFEDKIKTEYAQIGKDLRTFDKQDFFCNELCSVRSHCPRAKAKKK